MGLFDRGGGQDAGNIFQQGGSAGVVSGLDPGDIRLGLSNTLNNRNPHGNTYSQATNVVMGNGIQGGLFGPGGQLQQSEQEATNLANKGYSLQPEDYEAYGQGSGSIARMFGGQEQGIAEDLASRGLSNSGVAGKQFSNMYGNKQEQLAGLQTNIAQKRMEMNQKRLADTRNYVTSLGSQGQNAINAAGDSENRNVMNDWNMRMQLMNSIQGQNNEALSQHSKTGSMSTGEQLSAGLGMASTIGSMAAGMPPGIGGGGGSKAMAGGSSMFGGGIA